MLVMPGLRDRTPPHRVCQRDRCRATMAISALGSASPRAVAWCGGQSVALVGYTGERSEGGLSWCRCTTSDAITPTSRGLPGGAPAFAMAYLEREMGWIQGKGKMLADRGRVRRFGEGKIATEHRHHRFDFEEREVASRTPPRPTPKGHTGLGRVSGAELHGRGQPALGLKL